MSEYFFPSKLDGRWWVAHTKPRQEKALARDFDNLGIFHYLALQPKASRSRKSGRISHSTIPLFPGYLFFNATPDQRHIALTTNRIVSTLEVPDDVELVHQLRQIDRLLNAPVPFKKRNALMSGDRVRIRFGPLEDLEGVVIRRLNRLKLALNVRMLGQSVVVEVEQEMLEHLN